MSKRTFVIVGTGKGLGNAIAKRFGKNNFRVILISRNIENLNAYKKEFEAVNIYISPIIGAGMTVILLLIGAMAGGVVVDKYGLFESAKKPFTLRKFTGLALMIIGAVFIKLL